jgi:hypothetical protein
MSVFTWRANRLCATTPAGKGWSSTWASAPWSVPKKQRACYSGKKKRHTPKAQVLLERGTRRILAVRVGKGRRHDFHLCKQSQVRVHPSVPIYADSGYQGLQKLHANTRKPTKATKKRPLTSEQKRVNRAINSRRVVIEHTIRRLKVFRLLGERYRSRRRRLGLPLKPHRRSHQSRIMKEV